MQLNRLAAPLKQSHCPMAERTNRMRGCKRPLRAYLSADPLPMAKSLGPLAPRPPASLPRINCGFNHFGEKLAPTAASRPEKKKKHYGSATASARPKLWHKWRGHVASWPQC